MTKKARQTLIQEIKEDIEYWKEQLDNPRPDLARAAEGKLGRCYYLLGELENA